MQKSCYIVYMKNLLIILLSFLFLACDQGLSQVNHVDQEFSYCDANFVPSSWIIDHCVATDYNTCCNVKSHTQADSPYHLSEIEMCYDHDQCRWHAVKVTRMPEVCLELL
jgi:hypothetical protein